jgi:hypothetical protein
MFFVFPLGGKQNNAITGICKHLRARKHTHVNFGFITSSHNTLLYAIPAIQLLTTPTHTSPLLSSANTSPPLRPTAHNHGYYAVADYSSAAILSPGLCARSPKKDKKCKKGKRVWIHTHPTVSSKRKGRCVQSLVQIVSEM